MRAFVGRILLAALAIGWGVAEYRAAAERATVRTRLADPVERLKVDRIDPPFAEALFSAATASEKELVPPDYARAASFLEQALVLDPHKSSLWMTLARVRIFQGRRDDARAALERAETIDPRYPRQRLEAVSLWYLLGERDRARDIAAAVARFDAMTREEAAERLRTNGESPAYVYTSLQGADWTPDEQARLLPKLASGRADANRELLALLPTPLLDNPRVRNAAASVALRPILYDDVMGLWERHATELGIPETGPGQPRFPAALGTRFFGSGFPLGWRALPKASDATVLFKPAPDLVDAGTTAPLALEFTFDEFGLSGANDLRWEMYRTVLPASDQPTTWTLAARVVPPALSQVRLRAEWGGAHVQAFANSEEWSPVQLVIPPADKPRLVTLSMHRNRLERGRPGLGRVWLYAGFEAGK